MIKHLVILSLLISNFSMAMEDGQELCQQDVMNCLPDFEEYYYQEQDQLCWNWLFLPSLALSLLSATGSLYANNYGKIPHMNDFMMTTFLIVVVCTAATNIYSEYVYKIIGKMKDTHIILLQGDAKTLEDAANKAGLDSKYIDKLHEYIKFHSHKAYELEAID
jgi:hypothetical protein